MIITKYDTSLVINYLLSLICKESKECTLKTKPIPKDAQYDVPKYVDDIPDFIKKYLKEKQVKNYKIIDLFKLMIKYSKTRSDIVLDALIKLAKPFESSIKATYSVKALSVSKLVLDIQKILNSDDIILPFNQLRKLKEENPVLFETYKVYLQEYMTKLKKISTRLISHEPNHCMKLTEFNNKIQTYGFLPIYNNISIDYLCVNIKLGLVLRNGRELKCNIPLYGVEIIPNLDYRLSKDNSYVLKFKTIGSSVWQYCYTVDFKKKIQKETYKKIKHLLDNIEYFRKRWLKDLSNNDPYIRQAAIITEIIYQTAARVGTKGNITQGSPTYGISTLLKKHIKITQDVIEIKYPGKDGIIQYHVIRDRKLASALKKLLESKRKDEPVFNISGDLLNTYLRQRVGLDITIHKFRKLRGTELVYRKIKDKSCKDFKSEKDIMKFLKEVLTEVGEVLGHISGNKVTYTTALKNYVDPDILKYLFIKCGYMVPKAIQQLTESSVSTSVSPAVLPAQKKPLRIYYPDFLANLLLVKDIYE